MKRSRRILKYVGIGLIALLLAGFFAVTQIVQTDRFRNYVREKIITATQDALGGRVEISSFSFDWRHLHAEITDVVIHGTEPAEAEPFLRVDRVQVDLQLFTSFSRILNVKQLRVERPKANVIVLADGTLNIPRPAKPSTNDTTPLKTVVDLAIGHFELSDGLVHYNAMAQAVDVRGENLRVQLTYNLLTQGYRGQLSLQPLYVIQGRKTPVVFTVTLPVVLEGDKISVADATVSTPASELKITGSIANLKQPEMDGRVNGHVAIADLNALGNLNLTPDRATSQVLIDADAKISNDSINLSKLRLQIGNSRIEAAGVAKDAQGNGSLEFSSALNLNELMRLGKIPQKMSGEINIDGTTRFTGQLLSLQNMRIRGWGGELNADATLQDFARFQLMGAVRGVNLQALEQRLGMKPLPYDGTIAGTFEVQGDLKAPSAALQAKMNLGVIPGRRGIPLSGRINAEYRGDTGLLQARNSYLALPNSRLNFAGSLPSGIRLELSSQNLNDLFAAIPDAAPPVRLNGGKLQVTATVAGTLDFPRIKGHAATTRIAIQDHQFDTIASDFSIAKSDVALQNGLLSRGADAGHFQRERRASELVAATEQSTDGHCLRQQRRSRGHPCASWTKTGGVFGWS